MENLCFSLWTPYMHSTASFAPFISGRGLQCIIILSCSQLILLLLFSSMHYY